MPQHLTPSIRQLIAFETCSRTLSITSSAQALHLTQSAVSHQIKDLESLLGLPLFIRQKQRLLLTPEGKQYANDISNVLAQLRRATLNLTSCHYGAELHLSLLPTLGTRWLMPLIPDFSKQHPEITLHFSTCLEPFDFSRSNADVAFHYGEAKWDNANMVPLFSETLVPVCSKDFLKNNPVSNVNDLSQLPRLTINNRLHDWKRWCNHYCSNDQSSRIFYFEHFTTMVQATCSGLGIALVPEFLFKKELDDGELVKAINAPLQSEGSYYFVYPEHKAHYRPVEAFKDWLLKQSQ